jgi:hypothetical protein
MGVISVTPRPWFTPARGLLVPIGQEAGWTTELVWMQRLEGKSFATTGDRALVVQSVVRRCNVWARLARGNPRTKQNYIYCRVRSWEWADWLCQYSVWLRAGRPGDRGSIPGRDKRIFPLDSMCRPALGPTQPPVQWVPWVLNPRLKRGRGVTLTTHPT